MFDFIMNIFLRRQDYFMFYLRFIRFYVRNIKYVCKKASNISLSDFLKHMQYIFIKEKSEYVYFIS